MIKLIKSLLPYSLRIYWNQLQNKRKYDVIFGKGAKAYNCNFEGKNLINNNSSVIDSYIGFATYIAGNTTLKKVKTGRYCSIGRNVETGFGNHPTHFVSTHPCFYSLEKQAGFTFAYEQCFKEHKYTDLSNKYYVEIGNDVWIGNDVRILDGIKIGDGALIAMGSVVTKDIQPYTINGGIPSKIIRKRFDDYQIEQLLKLKWWERSKDVIEGNANYFLDLQSFLNNFPK